MAETIKIALQAIITGPLAEYDEQIISGARAAVAAINNAGGTLGKNIELVIYSDAADPKQAVAVANKVVNDKVKFLVGPCTSSCAQPVSDIYEDEGVLMVTSSATSPEITSRGYTMIFRTCNPDEGRAIKVGDHLIDVLQTKRVAVLHDKGQYGEGLATAVKQQLEKRGNQVPFFGGVNAGDHDFSGVIAQIVAAQVDAVFFGGYFPEAYRLVRQMRETKGLEKDKVIFIGGETIASSGFFLGATDHAEGCYAVLDDYPQDEAGPYKLATYAAIQVIAAGITAAKSEDASKVAEAIRAADSIETVLGNVSYDSKGDLKGVQQFALYRWEKNETRSKVL